MAEVEPAAYTKKPAEMYATTAGHPSSLASVEDPVTNVGESTAETTTGETPADTDQLSQKDMPESGAALKNVTDHEEAATGKLWWGYAMLLGVCGLVGGEH